MVISRVKQKFSKTFSHLEIDALTDYSFLRHPLAYLVEAADDIFTALLI